MVERFFGTLKYEHLDRATIGDGNALAVEVNLFRRCGERVAVGGPAP